MGKIDVSEDYAKLVKEAGFKELFITYEHAQCAGQLVLLHNDAFDRLLVAQVQEENMILLTVGPQVLQYEVKVF